MLEKFLKDWTQQVGTRYEILSSYACDIQVIDVSSIPTFKRSNKMRKRRRITIDKIIAIRRKPKSVVYKDCYPVSIE